MCNYSNLLHGQQTVVTASASCGRCGRTKNFRNSAAIYKGHVTYGNVYDKFDLLYSAVCPCGEDIESVYVACDTGIVADISSLFTRKEQ